MTKKYNKPKIPGRKKVMQSDKAKKQAKFRGTKVWKDFCRLKKLHEKNTCYICGIKKKGLHLHHCDPEHYEDLTKDFYLLCNACHRSFIERLIGMTTYNVDIDKITNRIVEVYNNSLRNK